MKSTHRSRLLLALLVAIVTAALHYYAVFVDLNGEFRELGAMDTWFRMREPRTPPKELIIVRLDEETYQHLGVSTLEPFPRAHLARVVRKIAENGASALSG